MRGTPRTRKLLAEAARHPLWDEFLEWAEKNEPFLDAATDVVREARRRKRKIGISFAIELLRWNHDEMGVPIHGGPEYEFQNSFKPLLSRLIAYESPELADTLEFRPITQGKRAQGRD